MTQTPAGWYADPEDAAQFRYWDGNRWTDDRSPRAAEPAASKQGGEGQATGQAGGQAGGTAEKVTAAGQDVAEGIAGAFSSLGSWVQQQVATSPGQPTFTSLAASCRDEPPRQPLSTFVELSPAQVDLAGVGGLFEAAGVAITQDGVQLTNELCRVVPNPWDPQDPTGVAVFVSAHLLGRLPADVAAAYSPGLTALTQRRLLATGTATVWAQGAGLPTTARVTMSLPDASGFSA